MKVYFPNTAIKKSCSFFLALMMFPFFVQSQSKSVKPAVKPIKNIVKTPVVNNKIVIKTGSFSLVKTPEFIKAAAGGTILYDVIYIPFYITGSTPKKDMPVKLNIKSYSKTNSMLFVTSSGPLANDTETIQKEQFDGTTKLISIPVRVVYNGPIDMDAEAYIKIDGQDNEYYKVAFGSEVKKDNAGEKITDVAPVNTTGVAKATITLLDSVSTFTLDTIRPNTANSYQVKLFLKLGRGLAKDSVLNVSIKPVQPLQNLELPAADQKVTIQIDKDDWNDAADTVVNKYVEVLVQQKTLAKDEQGSSN
ncbi:hypothetical protein [Mucilaginibacter flavus]|uniref:hypothetical protein n=1 Tax=Mucilaginibacter flavus TaxID=931504 RepID=UPI0025B2F2CE|nr:hypothetical protein [Mucilaginibacter flavus]MDN3581277.1 hypothetical protein [Mucilaginibacter flavus]